MEQMQMDQMRKQIEQLSIGLGREHALNQLQRNQITLLQKKLAEESGKTALTGLFAGLTGAVIGGAHKGAQSNDAGDDEDA